jgi:16S rRNA (cytosine1402-N4)-methyltransferase
LPNTPAHIPVLLKEVLELAAPQPGDIVVDCTLGLGGHARAFLEKIGEKGKLIGLDADARNLDLARENLREFKNIELIQANFRELKNLAPPSSADVVFFDLGMSSLHFDDPSRGFSYRASGPLDMRLDTSQPLTAAGILNGWTENKITEILKDYGEIRTAPKLARHIVIARKKKKLETTTDLAEIIEAKSLLPQVFQALRIAVNDELAALVVGLNAALEILKPGGRLAVIAFHSLEDRLVKNFLRDQSKSCICPPEKMQCDCQHSPALKILTKKPITPSEKEISANPRSRSAKLRVARIADLGSQITDHDKKLLEI